ncbi:MAG TPA: FG-GAP-like repeat-containing protein [Anaerolineae bacterium]|nr:FG-GAP-like repeat-containing protein [Anaerolineae bacterium]
MKTPSRQLFLTLATLIGITISSLFIWLSSVQAQQTTPPRPPAPSNLIIKNAPNTLNNTSGVNEVVWVSPKNLWSSGVAWGDIDADGDLDLAVSNQYAENQIFRNDGRDQNDFYTFALSWQAPSTHTTSSLAFGDLDGDGDLDLAVANANDYNQIYINQGGAQGGTMGSFALGWEDTFPYDTTAIAIGDMNGDGILDLVTATNGEQLLLYTNELPNAGVVDFSVSTISIFPDHNTDVALGDLDRDGDLDVVVANLNAVNVAYVNMGGAQNGTPGTFAEAWTTPANIATNSVALGDANNDGNLDIAFGNASGHTNTIYFNDKFNFANSSSFNFYLGWQSTETNNTTSVAWGDPDNDGDLDLAVGNGGQTNRLYQNDGQGQFTSLLLDNDRKRTSAISWGDMDGDGDVDLAVVNDNNQVNQIYQNNYGRTLLPSPDPIDAAGGQSSATIFGDIDNDGDLDLIIGNYQEDNHVYFNNGGGDFTLTPAALPNEDNATRALALGDVDNDGDLDLAVANDGAPNQLFLNDGWGFFTEEPFMLTLDAYNTYDIAWGDVDGDGDLDLVEANYGQPNYLYINQISEGFLYFEYGLFDSSNSPSRSIAWGDADADGDLDLVVGNWNDVNKLFINQFAGNNIEAPTFTSRNISGDTKATTDISWGDANNDGNLDLLVANSNDVNQLFFNNGAGNFNAANLSTDTKNSTSAAWGDVDGDGDLDIIVANTQSEPNQLFINQLGAQGSNIPVFEAQTLPDTSWTRHAAWGDVDRDGDLDLALANWGINAQASQIFINNLQGNSSLPNNVPSVYIHPFAQNIASGYATPIIISDTLVPISYTLYDRDGDAAGRVAMYYSFNGGGQWFPAQASNDTNTTNLETLAQPVANPDYYIASAGIPLTVNAPGVMGNDIGLRATLLNLPSMGDLSFRIDGSFIFTPTGMGPGMSTSFTYLTSNGGLLSAPTTVFIDVVANTAPIATDDYYFVESPETLVVGVPGVLINDFDAEGNDITAQFIPPIPPPPGIFNLNNDGSFTYQPPLEFSGLVSFTYRATDGLLPSPETTIYISVTAASFYEDFESGLTDWTADGLWTTTSESTCGTTIAPFPSSSQAAYYGDGDCDYDTGAQTAGTLKYNNPIPIPLNTNSMLSFMTYESTECSGDCDWDNRYVEVSTDDINWQTLGELTSEGFWYEANFDLSAYAGTDIYIRFRFDSVDDVSNEYLGWFIDDVTIESGNNLATLAPKQADTTTNLYDNPAPIIDFIPLGITHVYTWDTFASGFFGQSDNVLLRFEVYPQNSALTLTYRYTSTVAGSYQRPFVSASNLPARIRGTQIQVKSDTPITITIPAESNALAHLAFEEGSGTTTTDITGNGYDGSLGTGVSWSSATPLTYSNHALAFAGGQASLPLANSSDLDSDTFAVSMWVKVSQFNTTWQTLIAKGDNSWRLHRYQDTGTLSFGTTSFDAYNNRYDSDTYAYTNINDGQWHHIAIVYNHQEKLLYIDGALEGYDYDYNPLNQTTAAVHIGNNVDKPARGFNGFIDDVRYFDRALDDLEISQLAAGQDLQPQPDTTVIPAGSPAPNAIVYRLPAGNSVGATPLAASNGIPYRTNNDGILQGRGQINISDTLYALLPISHTHYYTLYHSSGTPTTIGVDGTPVSQPGLQTLNVSSVNPLILFNLDISLEWDARNDYTFLADLEEALTESSAILFDVSDGQMALGNVRVYQERTNWLSADIALYANSSLRPTANMGGVVNEFTNDIISPTKTITDAYLPGQIRMGPTWDPYGQINVDLGQEWWRALAHELAHYLLFLPDNYIGLQDGVLRSTDCQGSFMTNTSDDNYSEFLTSADWTGDCLRTVAQLTTERDDWTTITNFYPMITPRSNSGPSAQPLSLVNVNLVAPAATATTIPVRNYDLRDAGTGSLLPLRRAQGYLLKANANTADLTDDTILNLGKTSGSGDRIKVRGAETGDRVCIFDSNSNRLGCVAVTAQTTSVSLDQISSWQPQITVTPLTSRTFAITVAQSVPSGNLNVQVVPDFPHPLTPTLQISPWAAMTAEAGNMTFTQQITLDYPSFSGIVRVWEPGSSPALENMTQYYLNASVWSGNIRGWGGNIRGWGGNIRGWGGNIRGWGAPMVSGDGQVSILNSQDPFGDTGTGALQALSTPPNKPSWLTLVGSAYRLTPQSNYTQTVSRTVAFQYLQREVPDGYEFALNVYYLPAGSNEWLRLNTNIDTDENLATAAMPTANDGIYALMATVPLPQFSTGWNLFGYPIPETRPITTGLASIDGAYTSVQTYDPGANNWNLYDTTVIDNYPQYASLVNNLTALEFGRGYWIYATENITLYTGVPSNNLAGPTMLEFPPAHYYGPINATTSYTPVAGDTITAMIGGVLCGQGEVVTHNASLAYIIQIKSDTGDGCGLDSQPITFYLQGQELAGASTGWNNSQANYHPLTAAFPAVTPPLAPTATNNDAIDFSWPLDNANCSYTLYQNDAPYFDPVADGTPLGTFSHTTNLYTYPGNANQANYFILAADNCNNSSRAYSQEVGQFKYSITSGS